MSVKGSRKAALALAALHPRDRRWMLAHLPSMWRRTLAPLVDEARAQLAIDPELLQWALRNDGALHTAELPTPDVVVAALDRLGDAWAARVLALAAPDHVEVYLSGCDKRRGDAIRQELAALPKILPPHLAAAVTRFLRGGLSAVPVGEDVR